MAILSVLVSQLFLLCGAAAVQADALVVNEFLEPVSFGDTSLHGTVKGEGNPPFLAGHRVRGTTVIDSSFNFMPVQGYFIRDSSSNVWNKARNWND